MEENAPRTMCLPQSEEDWESRKAVISDLYHAHHVTEIKETMEKVHFFKATYISFLFLATDVRLILYSVDQYKKRFQKWGLKSKRTTDNEYRYMVKKERERRQKNPEKETVFLKEDEPIDPLKIVRFRKRKRLSDDDEISNRCKLI